jgi:hypothetical protein
VLKQKASSGANWLSPATLIAAVIVLAILEGALRKWVFASNPMMRYGIYFSKDVLFLFAAYLGVQRGSYFRLSGIVTCGALILLPSMGPTLLTSNYMGVILSLRAYLLIPLCAYLAAPLVRGFSDVERCAIIVAVLAVSVAILSAYQYSLSASHWLNRYDSGLESLHIVATAGHVRATGTFAYISGMAMMAALAGWAGTFLTLPLSGRRLWVRAVGICGLGAGFICSATSMSRGGLAFWGVSLFGGCLLYFRPKQILGVLLAILLISPFMWGEGSEEGDDVTAQTDSITSGLAYRLENADSFLDRAFYMLMNLNRGISNNVFGEGLGTGQAGSRFYATGTTGSSKSESEWGRIAFEVGSIGLLGVLVIRFVTCRRCWKALLSAKDDRTRLVMATSLPFFGILSLGWMAFNHTGNSFAWAVIAFALAAACGYGAQAETAHLPAVSVRSYRLPAQ